MKFGVCIGDDSEKIAICKKLGFDYVESSFGMLASENEERYNLFQKALKENNFPCISVNCFLPGSLKVTGPDVDNDALIAYIERGMRRGAALGVKKVVFGSSGARNVVEGLSYETAVKQIVTFLRNIVSPIADKYGITVVIEPLCSRETNIIESLREGAVFTSIVDCKRIRLLVDLYHAYHSCDTNAHIRLMTGMIKHAHIAEPEKRKFPKPGDTYDYSGFINALIDVGCDTCSVEASCSDFETEAADAIKTLRDSIAG